MMDVSIVIRTKNQQEYLSQSLPQIWAQQTRYSLEVILIDSGSPKGVVEWILAQCEKHPGQCYLELLKPEEFGFSYALNRGIQKARGQYVISLSGDAVPAHTSWLENLLRPLGNNDVAGVYGKQVPKTSADPIEKLKLAVRYHDRPKLERRRHIFSNANSAFRRALAVKYPFDESLPVCEDYDWARRMQLEGYLIAYQPEAVVYHTHDVGPINHIRRIIEFAIWRFRIDHLRKPLEARTLSSEIG